MQPSAVAVQACPFLLLQRPVLLQVPAQRPVESSWLVRVAQVRVAAAQIRQAPGQSVSVQQPAEGMQDVAVPMVQALMSAGQS
jgi:hypothetical protein